MQRLLAADIGGTNSRFAVFSAAHGGLELLSLVTLSSRGVTDFTELLARAVEELGLDPEKLSAACLAVAGPVVAGRWAKMANASFTVDLRYIGARFPAARFSLINDFTAQAFACVSAAADGADVIQAGQAEPGAALAVVGAGTGLGHCALVHVGGKFAALPSEAGHAAFPFAAGEADIQGFVAARTGMDCPYVETLVSGSGLALIHAFVTGREVSPAEAAAEISPDHETTRIFARFYARACRNYCLSVLARGGLFVSGGVAAKNPFLVDHPEFLREFAACPTFAEGLATLPIRLNRREDFGLFGAAQYVLAHAG